MKQKTGIIAAIFAALYGCPLVNVAANPERAADQSQNMIAKVVDAQIKPEMRKLRIPGMAVGVVLDGKRYIFNYGVLSNANQKPVTDQTIFEIGSVSKTFTATLASYAQIDGKLSLTDNTSRYFPALKDTAFGNLQLVNLGTHTPGGLPLQLPAQVATNEQLQNFLKTWKPTCAAGKFRTYNNPGIGMLGVITAQALKQNFDASMEKNIFSAIVMKHTFINVPTSFLPDYAQGYTESGAPTRVDKGMLAEQAYGIKTTAGDLLTYVEANMDMIKIDDKVQRAIDATHVGYFKVGSMTQDLIWEQYQYPVELKTLLEGNSPDMIFKANKATAITPPQAPANNVWINKTGSTNGCSAYVAYVPQMKMGIVMLANKSYPIKDRVTIAYQILNSISSKKSSATE